MIERVRRVVMGEPTAGSSEFTHVEEVAPRTTPTDAAPYTYDVWGWDDTPTLPHADSAPYPGMSLFPKTGGLRVLMMTFPPNWELPAGRVPPADPTGFFTYYDNGIPGMHATESIDIGIVVSGKVVSIAYDGTREVLGPGDVYIQNGAPHSWAAVGDEPSTIAFVLVPASRRNANDS